MSDMVKIFSISTGEAFVYDALTNKIIRLLGDDTESSVNHAVSDGIIRNACFSGIDFAYSFEEYRKTVNAGLPRLVLEITQQCNLRCKYCVYSGNYANARTHNTQRMSRSTMEKSIDFYLEHSKAAQEPEITFYGGEALLEIPLIKYAIGYIKERHIGKKIHIGISTNGTLVTDDVIGFLEENPNVRLNITMNGSFHDKYRVFPDGTGSMEIIMKNLENIRRHHERVWKDQINFLCNAATEDELLEMRDFYAYVVGKTPSLVTHINTAYGSEYINAITSIEGKRKSFLRKKFAGYYLRNNDDFFHSYFCRDLSGLVHRKIYKGSRGYIGSCFPFALQLFVDVNGRFSICEKTSFHYNNFGDVDNGFDFEVIKRLYNNIMEEANAKCRNCWAQRLCTYCYKDFLTADNVCRLNHLNCGKMRECCLDNLKLYCEMVYHYPEVYGRYQSGK